MTASELIDYFALIARKIKQTGSVDVLEELREINATRLARGMGINYEVSFYEVLMLTSFSKLTLRHLLACVGKALLISQIGTILNEKAINPTPKLKLDLVDIFAVVLDRRDIWEEHFMNVRIRELHKALQRGKFGSLPGFSMPVHVEGDNNRPLSFQARLAQNKKQARKFKVKTWKNFLSLFSIRNAKALAILIPAMLAGEGGAGPLLDLIWLIHRELNTPLSTMSVAGNFDDGNGVKDPTKSSGEILLEEWDSVGDGEGKGGNQGARGSEQEIKARFKSGTGEGGGVGTSGPSPLDVAVSETAGLDPEDPSFWYEEEPTPFVVKPPPRDPSIETLDVPGDALKYYSRAIECRESNDFRGIDENLSTADSISEMPAEFLHMWGEAKLMLRNYRDALAYLEKAVEKDPSYGKSWALLGQIALTFGESNRAVAAFSKAVMGNPGDTKLWDSIVQKLIISKNWKAYAGLMKAAVQYFPNTGPWWGNISLSKFRLEEYEESMKAGLVSHVVLGFKEPPVNLNMMLGLVASGRFLEALLFARWSLENIVWGDEEAMKALMDFVLATRERAEKEGVQLPPQDEVTSALAKEYVSEQVILALQYALEIVPLFCRGWYVFGEKLLERLDFESAREAFENARETTRYQPSWVGADELVADKDMSKGLAFAYAGLGDHEAALAEARKVLEVDPHDEQTRRVYVTALAQAGRFEDAVKIAKDYIDRNPNLALNWSMLAMVLRYARDFDGAISSLRKAAELDPKNPVHWSDLARIHEAVGEHDLARECAERASELARERARL
ncbi:MAG: tetratricopeptide repeat protein [Promethearchaeota archaeon]